LSRVTHRRVRQMRRSRDLCWDDEVRNRLIETTGVASELQSPHHYTCSLFSAKPVDTLTVAAPICKVQLKKSIAAIWDGLDALHRRRSGYGDALPQAYAAVRAPANMEVQAVTHATEVHGTGKPRLTPTICWTVWPHLRPRTPHYQKATSLGKQFPQRGEETADEVSHHLRHRREPCSCGRHQD
jgi:hypothetical protein